MEDLTLSGRRIKKSTDQKKKKDKETKPLNEKKKKKRGLRDWLMRKSPKYKKLMDSLGD